MLEERAKNNGKKCQCLVSTQFLNQVQRLLYAIPKYLIKCPRITERLMPIFTIAKHESSVRKYATHFVEVAMLAIEFVALANFETKDQFLLRMFVTGFDKEIGCKIQDLEQKTLVRAIDRALIHEKKLKHK